MKKDLETLGLWQKRIVLNSMMFMGAAILIASFFFPYWEMHMTAPQYPKGLHIYTYLDHVEGDIAEINIINHYIGMGKIDSAAKFERRIAWYVVLLLALGGIIVASFRFKINRFFYIPPVLFLIGFLGDFTYWMYKFGHELNPTSPITFIKPFMPTILGKGTIGQFTTIAYFSTGFWMAVLSTFLFVFALTKKRMNCRNCEKYHECKVLCNRGDLVLPKEGKK